jgi:hypothetical protein
LTVPTYSTPFRAFLMVILVQKRQLTCEMVKTRLYHRDWGTTVIKDSLRKHWDHEVGTTLAPEAQYM